MNSIPVIDLFAGPGGLGEGFSALRDDRGDACFKITLSIEKDQQAHSTLELRSFFRQFSDGEVPEDYYQFLHGRLSKQDLFTRFHTEANSARREAWLAELGRIPTGELRERIKQAVGAADPWVLIGGPPCQAYSVVGRARNKGVEGYLPDRDIRQTLYREYLSIIADHWPAVFVMENVKGLLSAKIAGQKVFERIYEDLESPAAAVQRARGEKGQVANHRYKIYSLSDHGNSSSLDPDDYVVESERHGIPQSRHRLILFGVREDYDGPPPQRLPIAHPVPLVRVLQGLPRLRSGLSTGKDTPDKWRAAIVSARSKRWLTSARRIAGEGVYHEVINTISRFSVPRKGRGGSFVPGSVSSDLEPEWFIDKHIQGACNHNTKSHMASDLHRYLYLACFAQVKGHSPKLYDLPADLMPNHENAEDAAKNGHGMFLDRFRVQLRNRPATTITSHIHKDGHYYVHYDPSQCRSLTVREAARVQTFPDNYFFCGPRTQQFVQVGNAVPPLLARDIAKIAWDLLR